MASTALTLLLAATAAYADSLTLSWDPNPERSVVGYVLYAGTSPGRYTIRQDVGSLTSATFDGVPGVKYFFAVAAYDHRREGPRSSEVSGFSDAPPVLAAVPSQLTSLGTAVSIALAGSDPDGSPVSYTATGLPAGVLLTHSTGLITGTPVTPGTYKVVVAVSDGRLTASQSFTWTVSGDAIPAADAIPPTVNITSPAKAAVTTRSAKITVRGTATDNVGLSAVLWTNIRGGGGSVAKKDSWSATVTLKPGVNNIIVAAGDAAGNVSTDMVSVTYVP